MALRVPKSKWWPSEENAKQVIFLQKWPIPMLVQNISKRHQDFENVLKFRHTLRLSQEGKERGVAEDLGKRSQVGGKAIYR